MAPTDPTPPTPAPPGAAREAPPHAGRTYYLASKTRHAPKWLALGERGVRVVSTWIDEAGAGDSEDLADLAGRCVREAASADRTILYVEPEDVIKGALIEVGASLAAGREVVSVGDCPSLATALAKHPRWRTAPTVEAALALPPHAPPGDGRGLDPELYDLAPARHAVMSASNAAFVGGEIAPQLAANVRLRLLWRLEAILKELGVPRLSAPSPAPGSPGWVKVTDDPASLPPDRGTVPVWLDPGEKGWKSGLSLGSFDSYCGWGLESWDGHARVTHWQRIVAPAAPATPGDAGREER